MLFDSHCHLTDNQFTDDLKDVLKRANRAGVREMMCVSQNVPDSKEAVALCERYKGIYCAIGVHPHEADGFRSVDINALKELCIEPRIRAVGEIGLDFFRTISSRSSQETAFGAQIELAKTMELPMVLHIRDASRRARAILEEHDYTVGVLHCFDGNKKMAEWAVDKGFYISFAGNLTYANPRFWDTVPLIPHDRLMIETDAPYLAPVPERGKRNEPAFVRFTLKKLAEAIGLTPRETADVTRENARRCFRIQS
ncbi:hypothetical protein CH330_03230 [candidate division WOR-3 bacterium JGI_Cruoil_03_51_56]|uniref:Hydrolase TatD n=1 Tax=candidate division WOR-3 bacterium JGI_Cruoil_03_51_56 TaxID=1973747 RepID=A0A235BVT2_UNCW3|nr:MAG: hypothetical protein CH330_03230 [candidate division WOR-3 bacterium JGI_Cruoil_03_51_56]